MSSLAKVLRRTALVVAPVAFAASLAAGLAACIVDPDPAPRCNRNCGSTAPTTTPTSTAPRPTTPVVVAIDTGRTLTSAPGEGAGIFVTYAGAGKWLVAWTCDTYASARSCDFDVSVSAKSIASLTPTPTNAILSSDGASFRARTNTSATTDSVSFVTTPGDSIVMSSTLNGVSTPSLVFFVSDGKLATAPSDPIELVPTGE